MLKSKQHQLQPVSACLSNAAAGHQFDSCLVCIAQGPHRSRVLPTDEEPAVLHVRVNSILQCTSEEVLNSEGAAVPTARAGWSRSGSCCHCGPPAGYACRRGPKRGAHLLPILPVAYVAYRLDCLLPRLPVASATCCWLYTHVEDLDKISHLPPKPGTELLLASPVCGYAHVGFRIKRLVCLQQVYSIGLGQGKDLWPVAGYSHATVSIVTPPAA